MEFLKVKPPWVDYLKETVSIICQRYTADTPVRVWNCSLQMLCKKNEPVSHVNERVGSTKGCSRNHKYSVFVFMIPHPTHTHTLTRVSGSAGVPGCRRSEKLLYAKRLQGSSPDGRPLQ